MIATRTAQDAIAALDVSIQRRGGVAVVAGLAGRSNGYSHEPEEKPAVKMFSLAELQAESQSVAWLVKHTIPADSLGVMFGGSGTFKSFVALDLALHVAHGLRWLGRKTMAGPVLYIAAEGGSGLWRRIAGWHGMHGLAWQDCPMRVVPVAVDLVNDAGAVTEAARAAGIKPALVVIDTLSQTFGGEENSASEVSKYLREVGTWFRATWKAAVLVIHHSGHAATERPRGSSAIRANVDFMLGVFRDENEMLTTVECHKQKDGERFADVAFRLAEYGLGQDDDGDQVSTLVASRVRDASDLLDALGEEASNGRKGRGALFLECVRDGIWEKELRAKFYEVVDLETAEARKKAFQRCMQWATKNQLVTTNQGVVYLTMNVRNRNHERDM